MRYVYFTKTLQSLDVAGLIAFCKETGLEGVDLAVRPGYPVTPENALTELPKAAQAFRDEKLTIGLATAPTSLADAESAAARNIFEACAKANVPAVKIGYFPYKDRFDVTLRDARHRLDGFAKLAAKTNVRALYHTHSGNNLGGNGSALRLLLADVDPHHIGAFVDTGHVAVGGGPFRMELDMVRTWLAMIAIKDMVWEKPGQQWQHKVAPAGEGIVHWDEVAKALRDVNYSGTISLHGEYETGSLDERKKLARTELEFLKKRLA